MPRSSARLHLLLLEDDRELGATLASGLEERGFVVERARTLAEARARSAASAFDLLVLDVALPDGSGIVLCGELRARGVVAPILLLTARDAVADRVAGLDHGADDYLVKPFAFEELVARLHALARRPPLHAGSTIQVHDLVVDLAGRRAHRGGRELVLTAKEFALLECLAEQAGRVTPRTTIARHVWPNDEHAFGNLLEVLVRRLRVKVDGDGALPLIHTVRGMGYRLGT
jgi:DNA-binding response OmpR family regulator